MEPADEGIRFVADQKLALDSLKGENVGIDFGSLSSHENLGKGKMANYGDSDITLQKQKWLYFWLR